MTNKNLGNQIEGANIGPELYPSRGEYIILLLDFTDVNFMEIVVQIKLLRIYTYRYLQANIILECHFKNNF